MKKIFDTREEKRIADIIEKFFLIEFPFYCDRVQIRAFANLHDPEINVEIFFDGWRNGRKNLLTFQCKHDEKEDMIILNIMLRMGDYQDCRDRLQELLLRDRAGIDGTVPPRKSI